MRTVFTKDHALHNPQFEILSGKVQEYMECIARADNIHEYLQKMALGESVEPKDFGLDPILAIHSEQYLQYMQTAYAEWIADGGSESGVLPECLFHPASFGRIHPNLPSKGGVLPGNSNCNIRAKAGMFCYDLSNLIIEGTFKAAYQAVQVALTGAQLIAESDKEEDKVGVFALSRPPGHHAHSSCMGGYCFFNNAAVAIEYLTKHTNNKSKRVACLDIDVHHGSVSETGAGEGEGYNLNLPLPSHASDDQYMEAMKRAMDRIKEYGADYLVVSMGLDTFKGDPLGDLDITTEGFARIGAKIAEAGVPTLFIMEGGYVLDKLGENAYAVLSNFEKTAAASSSSSASA